jgi:hypothetical protein
MSSWLKIVFFDLRTNENVDPANPYFVLARGFVSQGLYDGRWTKIYVDNNLGLFTKIGVATSHNT